MGGGDGEGWGRRGAAASTSARMNGGSVSLLQPSLLQPTAENMSRRQQVGGDTRARTRLCTRVHAHAHTHTETTFKLCFCDIFFKR